MWAEESGAVNGDPNHIKDISEVQAFQPHPFNSLNHWGVAVKAGSVHLIFSKDQKLGQKGGPDHTHNNTIPCLEDPHSQSSVPSHRKSTGSL